MNFYGSLLGPGEKLLFRLMHKTYRKRIEKEMYRKDQEEKSPLRGLGCLILFIGNVVTFEKFPFVSRPTGLSGLDIFVKVSAAVYFNLDKYICDPDTLEI